MLNFDETCNALGISSVTLKNWIRLNKIKPLDDELNFDEDYLENFVSVSHDCGKIHKRQRLTDRRNSVYKKYITSAGNISAAQMLVSDNAACSPEEIRCILFLIAQKLYSDKFGVDFDSVLEHCQKDDGLYYELLLSLRGESSVDDFPLLTGDRLNLSSIEFVEYEDTLGFFYISLTELCKRKNNGVYYTPLSLVDHVVSAVFDYIVTKDKTFNDICCGTGNFLLSLMKKGIGLQYIYGNDIDEISVTISRINVFLNSHGTVSKELLFSHIKVGDSLTCNDPQKFDVILGNPPWGSKFTKNQKLYFGSNFETASRDSIDSTDLFVEKGINMLKDNGYLALIIPEAMLKVAAHENTRKLLYARSSLKYIEYCGNPFFNVLCPAVFTLVLKDYNGIVEGCCVKNGRSSNIIKVDRACQMNIFNFKITDEEYILSEKIRNTANCVYLKNNADFGIGIVTGDNSKYIEHEKNDHNEIVLKGSDISLFRINDSVKSFINFRPEEFQQVANVNIYRASEKILYKFISKRPVFAYDNNGTLSLNSCNMVIPRLEGFDIKYILSVLNSSVSAFFLSTSFDSLKMLRSHIESIPIPIISAEDQRRIADIASGLIFGEVFDMQLYQKLDNLISDLFLLTERERQTVKSFIDAI